MGTGKLSQMERDRTEDGNYSGSALKSKWKKLRIITLFVCVCRGGGGEQKSGSRKNGQDGGFGNSQMRWQSIAG